MSSDTGDHAPPVIVTVNNGVAHIELNRPTAANALDLATAQQLVSALDMICARPEAKVVMMTGRGRLFCAGGDLSALASQDSYLAVSELARTAHLFVEQLIALERPVIVAVQGAAAGAGLGITLAADVVIAGRTARFSSAYGAVGLTPDCGTSWLLPRTVGLRRALELTLTGRVLNSTEAQAWGIVTTVVEDHDVASRARQLASSMAAAAPSALGATKRLVHQGLSSTLHEHLDLEAETIALRSTSSEARGLISSFLAKASAANISGDLPVPPQQ